jgi:transcriptional repressor of dcmA and dcmR
MEHLLNIKEAAQVLNVSEMSIRRWTNSGKLNCYRVGGKRERRFHMSDLEEFLHDSQNHSLKPLGIGDHKVPDGSHMTHFYSGKEEALGLSVPFVIEGFRHGEVVLVVMPPERSRVLLANLEHQGHPVAMSLKSGRLQVSEGMDSPEEMIRYLAGVMKKASQFRLVGDGMWAIRKGWDSAAFRALEEAGSSLRPREGKLFLCQYSLEHFSGSQIMMAAELHDQIIYKGKLEKSPYYAHEIREQGNYRTIAS